MFKFIVDCIPDQGGQQSEHGGASGVCWINFADREGAEVLVKFYLEQEGWEIELVDEVHWVGRDEIINDPESLQYFSEAEELGRSLIFYIWPIDG